MGAVRSLIAFAAFATAVSTGTGCAGAGLWKNKDNGWKSPEGVPSAPLSRQVSPDSGVVQAGALSQATSTIGSTMPSAISWMTGKSEKAPVSKGPASSIAVAWQNRIDYLPDPTKDGNMVPGLAGQVFLFGPRMQSAMADGTVTVDLFDETPRPAGMQGLPPERWQFRKDVLKNLRAEDERFGPHYGLFLPWLAYRPDVTRVRIKVRFDPEGQGQGFPLYAEETRVSLDTTIKTVSSPVQSSTFVPGMGNSTVDSSGPHMFGSSPPPAQGGKPNGPGPGMGVYVMGGGQPAGRVSDAAPTSQSPSLSPAPQGFGALVPAAPGAAMAPGTLPAMAPIVPGSLGNP